MKLVKKHFKKWDKAESMTTVIIEPNENPKTLEINFIDMPNAVQSNISLSSNVSLKMSDPDYHAVLIANKILGGGFNSYLNIIIFGLYGLCSFYTMSVLIFHTYHSSI